MRQPMGLKAAFKLAEEQEANERSDGDGTIDLRQAFNAANAEANRAVQGSPSPAPRSYRRRESEDMRSNQYFAHGGDGDLGQQLKQFDRNHQLAGGGGPLNGLFATRNRVGPKIAETTSTLARKASDSSLGATPEHRRNSQKSANLRKQPSSDMLDWENVDRDSPLASVEFAPLPPVELDPHRGFRGSPIAQPSNPSPEKSFNWHLDADFTAGDLQVSDSPRIKHGKANGGTASRAQADTESQASNSPNPRRSDARLNQIREREIEAANAIIPDDAVPKRTNSRLDEIKALEMEAVSRRAVARSRLDEIKAKNSEARSVSPETSSKSSTKDVVQVTSLSEPDTKGGEAIPDTPITIFRNSSNEKIIEPGKEKGDETSQQKPKGPSRDDSYDLLRRLARATSSSPPPQEPPKLPAPATADDGTSKRASEEAEGSRPRFTRDDKRPKDLEVKRSKDRLTVGFAGPHKMPSSDSLEEKRRSLVNSESDPTDRIEAEMKLFAPMDNYSEKGSVRAPSPDPSEPSDPIEEETPRPGRFEDPLTQPTPRVTGAYVDTPATIKVGRDDDWVDVPKTSLFNVTKSDESEPKKSEPKESEPKESEPLSDLRSRHSSRDAAERKKPSIKREGSDTSEKVAKTTGRSASIPVIRRARSLSRRRRPLINTAKIPTVKEDLRTILREHRIDDSTIDDFDELLANRDIDHEELERMVGDSVVKVEEEPDVPGLTDRERELQTYDRMSKSLKTGLLGIRSAKQGIERLEDKVAHSEHKSSSPQVFADLGLSSSSNNLAHRPQHGESALYIPFPALYRRQPRFKLTAFGLLSLILAIWYTVESALCSLYVTPYECTPTVPCYWSPNEPYFPYATPFMLDEWTTGGRGRALAWRAGEEMGDIMAEVVDWVTGNDFAKEDELYMNVWERKRHRRRLQKNGLVPKWVEPIEFKDKFKSWREAWSARAKSLEDGVPWIDESMSADERL